MKRLGEGPVQVLCLHGLGSQGLIWQSCLPPHLFQDFTFFCPDLPGHGDGPRLSAYTLEALLENLIKRLDPLRPFPIVIGHSLGAILGLELQIHFEELGHLIALDFFPRARHPRGLEVLARHFRQNHLTQLRQFMSFSHTHDPCIMERILADAGKTDENAFPEILESLALHARGKRSRLYPKDRQIDVFHQPPSALQADPKTTFEEAWSPWPKSQLHCLPKPGHFVMLTNPREFTRLLSHCLTKSGANL